MKRLLSSIDPLGASSYAHANQRFGARAPIQNEGATYVQDQKEQQDFTKKKVVRRGLLAGIAGLSAAAVLKAAGKAEAADGGPLVMGVTNNVSPSTTQWNV